MNNPHISTISSPSSNATEIEEEPVKLLYSKSKVYVHPSSNTVDFIPGFMSIVEKSVGNYLVAWTPEALIPTKDIEAFVQVDVNPDNAEEIDGRTNNLPIYIASVMVSLESEGCKLYAISTPVDAIHSFLIKPPSFSKWYGNITINFKDGHSSAPLWFHDDESKSTTLQKNTQGGKFTSDSDTQTRWGGDEFLARLGQLIHITRSPDNESLYIVKSNSSRTSASKVVENSKREPTLFESTQMDPFVATVKEARWNILEKLSRVTKFSRDTALSLLSSPASRPFVPLLPHSVQELCSNETVKRTIDDYDSARIFLAKWAAGLAAQSENSAPRDRKYRHVGVWGHDGGEEDTALGVFEILNSENDFSIPTHTRREPVGEAEWETCFDTDGKLTVEESTIKKMIFCGGLSPAIRREAWLFLTGVYAWNSTAAERNCSKEQKRDDYQALKSKWSEDTEYRKTDYFKDQKHRIDKDIHRTDRSLAIYANETMPNPDIVMNVGTNEHLETLKDILCTYNVYNTNLGYVQGMSDLLSPIYVVIRDEALSFWAFAGFMDRMKSNFYKDQSGMHKQLLTMDLLLQFMDPSLYKHLQKTDSVNFFFCFRWMLVWFKREFKWDDMLVLWEVLWTDYLTSKFHLFVALSILDQHRDVIIEYLTNFDEVLKYINDLSLTINLEETLQRAEILYYQFKQRVEAVDCKREQLKEKLSNKSTAVTEDERELTRDDLAKLPVINELLREILSSSFTETENSI
ncbi:rab-GTPase-TBC domain-containing protein [Mycotypha africana]|uniref:rab-GTPase-TBC domain-containing protein n=1 Tax=Mycotypha africana TaxID=64632 RepID=UPI002301388F|nr:rab-GTPase-TBC domain-containing protein [Mycotypha africana]KAI8981649.1 rab-GTPase-TBC domain-containing protein [Mycotypha africana]